jgi:hypothetical protein
VNGLLPSFNDEVISYMWKKHRRTIIKITIESWYRPILESPSRYSLRGAQHESCAQQPDTGRLSQPRAVNCASPTSMHQVSPIIIT